MTALAAQGYPADDMTASLTHLVMSLQRPNGSWLTEGVSRPPIEDSDVSTTAMAVRALTLYPLPGRAKLLTRDFAQSPGLARFGDCEFR